MIGFLRVNVWAFYNAKSVSAVIAYLFTAEA